MVRMRTDETAPSGPSHWGIRMTRRLVFRLTPLLMVVVGHTGCRGEPVNRREDSTDYVKAIQQYVGRDSGRKLVVGDASDYTKKDDPPRWTLFDSEKALDDARDGDNLHTSAEVWLKNKSVVFVSLFLSSPSGDWAHRIDHVFRANGALVKMESELRTFYGDAIVSTHRYYDDQGKVVSEGRSVRDLETGRPVDKGRSFLDRKIDVYRRVDELPFWRVIEASVRRQGSGGIGVAR